VSTIIIYAISYAAGDHKDTEEILVNKRPFNAFRSLAEAVRAIRDQPHTCEASTTFAPLIWADQICINQSDPDERAYQVQYMRDIYETARGAIIYLGEDTYNGRGVDFVRKITAYLQDRRILLENEDDVSLLNRTAEWVEEYAENPAHTKDWMALREILEAPWWRRGWICQEAITSKTGTIVHGTSTISIETFTEAFDVFKRAHRILLIKYLDEFRKQGNIITYIHLGYGLLLDHAKFILTHRYTWEEEFIDIKELLRHSRRCKTTDYRDRVYAFVGLAHPDYNIKPIYWPSNSLSATFSHVAARIIIEERNLDILLDATEETRLPDLPS